MIWVKIAATLLIVVLAWIANSRMRTPAPAKTIVNVVLGLIVIGIALWLINTFIPMAGSIRAILNLVVVIACCVGVLRAVGLWGSVVRMWNNFTHRAEHGTSEHV